jgi:hypothetical protein
MTNTLNPTEGTRFHNTFFLVENGAVVRQAQEVLSWLTDDGLRPTDEWLAAEGFYGLVQAQQPTINPQLQKLTLTPLAAWTVNSSSGTVEQVWLVEDLSSEEQAEATTAQASQLRTRRLQLLLLSDYTQGLDFSGDRDSWAAYRQELRDVTDQEGFPWDVVWPAEPTT